MKTLRIGYEDKEWKALEKAKESSGMTWKEFIYYLSQLYELYWKEHEDRK